ncbi:pyruvate formate lyase-activating protein [Desertifilum sp. FACHB-1129]|uniref:Pyruvate formate-lyase-activating enzyme n=1 Tax=Desertifilum tharense IPPAS B-1220 TaxID=1781255 RepID=A0A1E5QKE7_9CYAN|nr:MULTISPECIES: pyruvate formate-lyase-activating protein [Desertifilum]MCD8488791.1 pyruvate formate lyase-activating protein [Desertifilum sp.]MDA0211817.1 pyruvate formate-lyase-activating protein [Cyanobacteria bacterium FC1]MDI9635396.1 pyruvate formate-lyase-activating protein [Geitlerinema splendidum]MDL5047412.1 pyruvate formate-lyase-activating protein [Oscillatoria amoena NRMC-F 0135]MBD2312046.1 pyruvate formate lyase-activating protein [Desertifilum sp. FACHB-1129]
MTTTGKIHSVETCGTVDGPGIRFVIFTQGCPLRCLYCHNPDCRNITDGKPVTVDELIEEIQKYRSYMRFSGGGVTVTGGEPLMQPEFVREIFRRCHELGIHTALDTSGYTTLEAAKPVLDYADLVLLDIKSFNPETYFKVTHVAIQPTLDFAKYLNEIHKPAWIRFVLVPHLTDDPENMRGLAEFVAQFTNVERLEVLPFHKMGEYKWEQLGYEYQLKDTPPASSELVESAIAIFQSYGLKVAV